MHQRQSGRSIRVGRYEQQLADARRQQTQPEWADDYRATRPKVERKIGHLVHRRHGGRRARVRGKTKVDAAFNLAAAAINLARLANLGFVGSDCYDIDGLRVDVSRFAFLLGGNDGEVLFGDGER